MKNIANVVQVKQKIDLLIILEIDKKKKNKPQIKLLIWMTCSNIKNGKDMKKGK